MNFITGNVIEAKEGFLEVIRQDPYVYGAWMSLASCYEQEGDMEAARQMKFFGAHVEGEGDVWKELGGQFRSV
jgi:general transcription factor 3C polypeptide 3 (transcription factor C subunit 4)